jgi:hypothetical protein
MSAVDTHDLETSLRLVARNILIDRLTVEAARALAGDGIDMLVLKGPVLAAWLYPGEVRVYCDSDLMVRPGDRARAITVLEDMGFREYCPWRPPFQSLDLGGTAFCRGDEMVDLHCCLPGLGQDPELIWASLLTNCELQVIAGAELRVPDRHSLLLHLALHAAHHANLDDGKPFEDLQRAIDRTDDFQWRQALELAQAFDGVPGFTAGLRLVPEGEGLVRRLGLEEVRSLHFGLRREDDVIAEEINALLASDVGFGEKLVIAARELFPTNEYMRRWSPLARHGWLGLMVAYAWRVLWAMGRTPRALSTVRRVRQNTTAGPSC